MSYPPRVTEWTAIIRTHVPHLTKPRATVLALWSLGLVLARSWALTAVRTFLATWLGRQEPAVRQPVREFCSEATAQRGTAPQALVVEACLGPLWAWVVDPWAGTPWARARDATTWGTRLTVLALRVVSRGGAIPGAWSVWAATAPHAGRREWGRRWRQVRRAIPRAWPVMVLAERGWSAWGRCRRLTRLGGQPFWRLNTGGTCRPKGPVRGVPLKTLVPEPGTTWQGTGLACKGRHRQVPCPRLAWWEAGEKAPWLMLPDLPPEASTACW